MQYLDIKPRKTIHDLTLNELMATYSEAYKRKNNIVIGKRIVVMSERDCENCHNTFLARPYQWNCSKACQDQSDNNADNWRNEE